MAVSVTNTLKELFKANKVALGMNVRLGRSGDGTTVRLKK